MTRLNYFGTLPVAAVVVGCLLLALADSTSRADTIRYSWVGTLAPEDPAIDPWGIGAGKPFTISGIVDEDAVDIDPEVRGAFFILTDAALVIDGVAASEFNDGTIWFREILGKDSIEIDSENVRFNGIRDGLFTVVSLPASTFSLTNIAEAPPVFAPAMMDRLRGAGTVSSSYGTLVDGGTVVTATRIPEPTTFVLALLAALGAGITVRRGRIR